MIGALRPRKFLGREAASNTQYQRLGLANTKVAAVLRGNTVMRARPETVLQPGDRLLMIASQEAQAGLLTHLVSPSVSLDQTNAAA